MQQHGPIDYHMSEVNQTDKEKYITAMWDLKCDTNVLIHETETDSQDRTDLWLLWGRDGLGFGD